MNNVTISGLGSRGAILASVLLKRAIKVTHLTRGYLKYCGFSTLIEATSPQSLQKVTINGDPTEKTESIGLIFP